MVSLVAYIQRQMSHVILYVADFDCRSCKQTSDKFLTIELTQVIVIVKGVV